jgi:hypothetical protein
VVSPNLRPGDRVELVRYGDDDFVDKGLCTIGDTVAFDLQGHEVARHPPGICYASVWVITTTAPPP